MFDRNFAMLYLAFLTSTVGTWLFRITVPIVLYEITGSPLAMSFAYGLIFLPIFLVMPIGGVIADHYDRKTVLIVGDAASSLVMLVLACIIYTMSASTYWLLYPPIFFLGCITSVYYPCFQAVVPAIVPPERLARANSSLFATESLINVVGPLLGGIFVATLGPTGAAMVNVATFAASLAFIVMIRLGARKRAVHALTVDVITARLREGFSLAMSNSIIKYGTIIFVFANFASHLVVGNLIYFLSKTLSMGPSAVGITIALTAVGGLLGALAAPFLIRSVPNGILMLAGLTIGSPVTLLLLAADSMSSVALARGASMAIEAIIVVTMFTLRQRAVPAEFLGRTVAITRAISFAPIPVAAVLGGWLIQLTNSMVPVIVASAAVLLLTSIWGWFTPFPVATRELRPA